MKKNKCIQYIIVAFLSVFYSACANKNYEVSKDNNYQKSNILKEVSALFEALPQSDMNTKSIKAGIAKLKNKEYEYANYHFKQGLILNPQNAQLHFLNALSYHLNSLSGKAKLLEFAQSGYKVSLRFDKSNFWASYFLGQIYFEKRNYKQAQEEFAKGLLYSPKNKHLLRALAVTSYYTQDNALNLWASKQAYSKNSHDKNTLKTMALAYASNGNYLAAKSILDKYNNLENKESSLDKFVAEMLSNRIEQWNDFYSSNTHKISTQADEEFSKNFLIDSDKNSTYSQSNNSEDNLDAMSASSSKTEEKNSTSSVRTKSKSNLPRMVLVDVIILRTEESRSESKGVNILDGLKTTLSGEIFNYNRESGSGTINGHTNKSGLKLSLDSLKYNLNIFNDAENKAEILARPSLLAVENEESRFYSGADLHVQLEDGDDGTLDVLPVGISLNVTPTFLNDGYVKIKVHAQRSFLELVSSKVTFKTTSQTARTTVDASAILKFGETLILSGLSEREKTGTKSGVPLLKEIPIIQYFFSKEEDIERKKSVIIMLTPRKPINADATMNSNELSNKLQDNASALPYTKALMKKENITKNSISSTVDAIKSTPYYRQFRQGDLNLDSWYKDDSIWGSIKRILGFLYY